MRLDGKVAIITGGGTGIGAACARRFAAEGAKVVVTGRRSGLIAEVAGEIGGLAVAGDVRDPAHAPAVVAAAEAEFGRVDIVVANAGIADADAVGRGDETVWNDTLEVNLTGPRRFAHAALPGMRSRGAGSIVFVSSVSAVVGTVNLSAYCTSKAALIALARSIAIDHGPKGVRCNAVCPGWVVTPMGDDGMGWVASQRGITRDEAYALTAEHAPLRRAAQPEEIAACCLFLASDESSIVTGTTLVADGGVLAVDVSSTAFG